MARLARVVVPGIPYHLTHRGNHRATVFFNDEDRRAWLAELAEAAQRFQMLVWGYCLMSNHIHLLAVPRQRDSLARAMGLAQREYARRIHLPRGWTGHLWAGRFHSVALDGLHLWRAIRYIELNPVRAGLVARAEEWPWSSARAHCGLAADPLLDPGRPFPRQLRHPLDGHPLDWATWLAGGQPEEEVQALRQATHTGRPLGDAQFLRQLEEQTGRLLAPQKRGPKPAAAQTEEIPGLFD